MRVRSYMVAATCSLIVTIGALAMWIGASAASVTDLRVVPASQDVGPGAPVTIAIHVDSAVATGGVEATVHFDASQLQVDSVTRGAAYTNANALYMGVAPNIGSAAINQANTTGTLKNVAVGFTSPGFTPVPAGDQEAIVIQMHATAGASGHTTITLTNLEVLDNSEAEIRPVAAVPGVVTADNANCPAPTDTVTPTVTDTPVSTFTPTDTPAPTDTPTATDTPAGTDTPVYTSTVTDTPTPVVTATACPALPTSTGTVTASATPSNTAVATLTSTPTPETQTPTATAGTQTSTSTPSTPTATLTVTTPSPTPTSSESATVFVAAPTTVPPSTTFEVDISMNTSVPTSGVAVSDIKFDPSILQIASVSLGQPFADGHAPLTIGVGNGVQQQSVQDAINAANNSGDLQNAASYFVGGTYLGAGTNTFLTVMMKSLTKEATSSINLGGLIQMYDSQGNLMNVTTTNGSVTVQTGAPTPVPPTPAVAGGGNTSSSSSSGGGGSGTSRSSSTLGASKSPTSSSAKALPRTGVAAVVDHASLGVALLGAMATLVFGGLAVGAGIRARRQRSYRHVTARPLRMGPGIGPPPQGGVRGKDSQAAEAARTQRQGME